jgi:hypothetical protein
MSFVVSELYMENDGNFEIDKVTCSNESIEQTAHCNHTKCIILKGSERTYSLSKTFKLVVSGFILPRYFHNICSIGADLVYLLQNVT